jgi:hypothetical protein
LASTDDLVKSIIGTSTATSFSAKAAADAMAAKTAADAAAMGEITKRLSIENTMKSRAEGGFMLMDLVKGNKSDMDKAMA